MTYLMYALLAIGLYAVCRIALDAVREDIWRDE